MGRTITEPVTIAIPVKPVSKKNSQRWVRMRGTDIWKLLPSEAYERYERDCGPFIRCKGLMVSCEVNVCALFYIDADRKCDLSNFFEALADMLVHYRVLEDDNRKIIVGWDGSRVHVDRQNPRTVVTIQPIEQGQVALDIAPAPDF